eukprot:1142532-Pelagomonas_calceolata.AAC.2
MYRENRRGTGDNLAHLLLASTESSGQHVEHCALNLPMGYNGGGPLARKLRLREILEDRFKKHVTCGAKNKFVHQYCEKEHVLHLKFDCKNTCHTPRERKVNAGLRPTLREGSLTSMLAGASLKSRQTNARHS